VASPTRQNLLLEPVPWKVDTTRAGTWRRYLHPSGALYEEFTSNRRFGGWPLLHYTRGINPETGRRKVARGFCAVGRVAVGVFALGQAAVGVVALGQLAIAPLLAIGQSSVGALALGQLALGIAFGGGQVATGYVAIGQLALGHYVMAQLGAGAHLWTPAVADPEAVRFFRGGWPW